MGSDPRLANKLFVLEKWLQPKKPLLADRGDGCAASKIKLSSWIKAFFCCACFPQSRKIIFFFFWISSIAAFVKFSQPIFEWDAGSPAQTERQVFNNKTPCLDHADRSPM